MNNHNPFINGLTVYNYNININEIVKAFDMYDDLFFFCPQRTCTVIQYAVKNSLNDITNYNPLNGYLEPDLMSIIIKDIELYQSKNQHPYLDDSNFIDNIEIIAGQIEEFVDLYIRTKFPPNQQCEIIYPKWQGNDISFALRIF